MKKRRSGKSLKRRHASLAFCRGTGISLVDFHFNFDFKTDLIRNMAHLFHQIHLYQQVHQLRKVAQMEQFQKSSHAIDAIHVGAQVPHLSVEVLVYQNRNL